MTDLPGILALIGDIVVALGVSGVLLGVTLGPLGRALADRVRYGRLPRPGQEGREEELGQEVDSLRLQVGELQERLDFAERLLAQAKDRGLLGGGGG